MAVPEISFRALREDDLEVPAGPFEPSVVASARAGGIRQARGV